MDIGKESRVIQIETEPAFAEPLLLDELPDDSIFRSLVSSIGDDDQEAETSE